MPYPQSSRRAYLDMIARIGEHWLQVFGDDREFYSTAYWDLLTSLWAAGGPMRKTDALNSMKGVKSAHTAGKYLDAAIRHGLVLEEENPSDARSKLVRLAPSMQKRLDAFFDDAVDEVCTTAQDIEAEAAAQGSEKATG